jgi:reductive dehalogenase
MSEKSIKRRDFLRVLGIGGAALGAGLTIPTVIARTENGVLVESKDEYGGFLVEKMTNGKYPYQCNLDVLKRMSQKFTVFSRNRWDPARQNRPELTEDLEDLYLVKGKGKVPNRTRLDYAFMAASWCLANSRRYPSYKWDVQSGMVRFLKRINPHPWDPGDLDMSWEDAAIVVKHAARFYGASLAGIAQLNPFWLYSDHYAPKKEQKERAIPVLSEGERFEQTDDAWYIPKSMNRVLVLAFEEDFQAISNSPGKLASAAVGNGYSRMAFTAFTVAEFIRALGYHAIPAGNGVGLSIPMAVDAGLGQLGRMGLLVTPKYGPRVRLAKVITDMPLVPDSPINFGVTEFCDSCMLCADHCPSGAITKGPFTWEGKSPSNNPGVYKWYAEPEKCYDFNGFSCSNCKRVCPFNKPNNSWLHRMIRQIVKSKVRILDKIMVTFDQAGGYGEQLQGSKFWKMNGDKTITGREEM